MVRSEVFRRLRSFDGKGLDAEAFERGVLALLDDAFDSAEAVRSHFESRAPLTESELPSTGDPKQAEQLLTNTFTFYDETHAMGPDIDWDRNPGTDHWGMDLNRFSFLSELMAAGRATGDEKFTAKGAALIYDWVSKCDICAAGFWREGTDRQRTPRLYVWGSYLNIAIHLVQWTRFFEAWVKHWSPGQLLEVLKSIHDQLAYLELIIPTRDNNWVMIGANGVMQTASCLPELRDSERFIQYGTRCALAEAERQALPDGMQFELTQGYHGMMIRLFCNFMELCRRTGRSVPGEFERVVERMIDYFLSMKTPDNKLVAFNDTDPEVRGDRFGFIEKEARRLERKDWLYILSDGREGEAPTDRSRAFEYGGVYMMRSGWGPEETLLVFDGGPWGKSHQHDDRLSFWLSALGRSFIIDPGRYLYDRNNPFSGDAYLKTTRAHNTIQVDGESQADRFFPETWVPRDRISTNGWMVRNDMERVVGAHTLGYGENGRVRVEHRRSITWIKPDVFLVLDELSGDGEHEAESRLHFYPGDVVKDGHVLHTTYSDANLAVIPFMTVPFEIRIDKGKLDPASGWYSPSVNHIEPSPTLVVRARAELPIIGGYLLVPYGGSDAPELACAVDDDTIQIQAGPFARSIRIREAMRTT